MLHVSYKYVFITYELIKDMIIGNIYFKLIFAIYVDCHMYTM